MNESKAERTNLRKSLANTCALLSITFYFSFLELEKSPLSKIDDFFDSPAFDDYKKRIEQEQENKAAEITAMQKTIANCASGIISAVADVAKVVAKKR